MGLIQLAKIIVTLGILKFYMRHQDFSEGPLDMGH